MSENKAPSGSAPPPPDGLDHELVAAALSARERAYCPYSNFAVGAALRTAGGALHTGTNVENASYGLSICAERNAIAAAVAGGMRPGGMAAIAIAAVGDQPVSPCGACRQVIAEFAAPDARVVSFEVNSGRATTWRAADLLPEAFKM